MLSDAELMEYLQDAFNIGITSDAVRPLSDEPDTAVAAAEGAGSAGAEAAAMLHQLLSQAFTRLDATGSGSVDKLDVEALLQALVGARKLHSVLDT